MSMRDDIQDLDSQHYRDQRHLRTPVKALVDRAMGQMEIGETRSFRLRDPYGDEKTFTITQVDSVHVRYRIG